MRNSVISNRERGDIGLFITLVFKEYFFLICWLNFRDFYWILIGWFNNLSVQTFQPLTVIYRSGNFVYHHWWCTSIYRTLYSPCSQLCHSFYNTKMYLLILTKSFYNLRFLIIIKKRRVSIILNEMNKTSRSQPHGHKHGHQLK